MRKRYPGKRAFDIAVAGLISIPALPIAIATALLIRARDGAPVLFKQERIGSGGTPFTIYKFRTMPTSAPNVPSAQSDGIEVSNLGRILRRISLDELPQLINVWLGDMSIVGPRPALPAQEDVLTARERAGVTPLLPGITGLAQVSSYDGMTTEEKVHFDQTYASQQSLLLDLLILGRTIFYLRRRPPQY